MNTALLKKKIKEIEKVTDKQWMKSLDERKLKELEFHDMHRAISAKDSVPEESMDRDTYEKLYGNKKYYSTTRLSSEYVDGWLKREAKGKVFLDYACGNGSNAIKAAKYGASLSVGIDISSVSVGNARKSAKDENLKDNIYFIQADCENTLLPDNSIEVIICSGMLHHLDLSYSFPELRRILAPGGKILGVEALDYNPFIKLYRNLTPEMRTDWEKAHILSMKDIEFAKRFFDIGEMRFFHISSIAGAFLKPLLPLFNILDAVLTRLPLVRLMSWIFTFELLKKK